MIHLCSCMMSEFCNRGGWRCIHNAFPHTRVLTTGDESVVIYSTRQSFEEEPLFRTRQYGERKHSWGGCDGHTSPHYPAAPQLLLQPLRSVERGSAKEISSPFWLRTRKESSEKLFSTTLWWDCFLCGMWSCVTSTQLSHNVCLRKKLMHFYHWKSQWYA